MISNSNEGKCLICDNKLEVGDATVMFGVNFYGKPTINFALCLPCTSLFRKLLEASKLNLTKEQIVKYYA